MHEQETVRLNIPSVDMLLHIAAELYGLKIRDVKKGDTAFLEPDIPFDEDLHTYLERNRFTFVKSDGCIKIVEPNCGDSWECKVSGGSAPRMRLFFNFWALESEVLVSGYTHAHTCPPRDNTPAHYLMFRAIVLSHPLLFPFDSLARKVARSRLGIVTVPFCELDLR